MKRFLAVIFWSVIAAAFIGPGTVTTAASAGAAYGMTLLWALTFSTLACWILQEASARLTVVSGRTLGEVLKQRYQGGWTGALVLVVVSGAILLGCAAYEAGNILGGVAGAALEIDFPKPMITLGLGVVAALLLSLGAPRRVALGLAVLVAVMGVAFMYTSHVLNPGFGPLFHGALVPSLPDGAALLALGLVGTTVVPYNLFLGSSLAQGQDLGETRFGLAVAVLLGGVISMCVLIVGAELSGPFSFGALAQVLTDKLGSWGSPLFAAGLLAAGLSSAVTAPLAAAVTARSLFAEKSDSPSWADNSWRFRAIWFAVLAVGVLFGMTGVRPVPAIIAAQAFNGILLPMVAIFLLLAVNDRDLLGAGGINRGWMNIATGLVVAVSVFLGVANVARATAATLGLAAPSITTLAIIGGVATVLLAFPVARRVAVLRRQGS